MKILFVCIHNSARSQMAEEITRMLSKGKIETDSAGINPGSLNPVVIDVLKEIGIDISRKQTKSVSNVIESGKDFDYVITVCDETSAERCPVFPGNVKRLHWSFRDPSSFEGTYEEKLNKTRLIRNEIQEKIASWLKEIT